MGMVRQRQATMQSLKEAKMENFVYIHNQMHINHCLTGPSLGDMKMGGFVQRVEVKS
jgi:hypothetical protein